MKFEAYRIWILFFVAIFAVSGYLYFKIQENQNQLQNHSYRSLELTKNNLLNSWDNYRVRVIDNPGITVYPSNTSDLLEDLLNQMPPSNFFNFVILTDTSGTVLHATGDIPVYEIPDSTKNQSGKLGATQSKLSVSSTEYLTFQMPVTLSQPDSLFIFTDLRLHLYGVISQDNFSKAGRQISFTLLYLLFTLVILLVISFPILRVVGMGRGDTLLRSHVYQIGLSIVLLAIFIGYSISYIMSRSEIVQDQYESIENLTNLVSHLHQHELYNFTELLQSYFVDGDTALTDRIHYNELIEINENGLIQRIRLRSDESELPDSVLGSLPSLNKRYYFRGAETDKYLISSHHSYLENGKQEGVISKKFHIDNSDSQKDSTVVRAVTFGFDRYNLLDSVRVNPIGIKYLVINTAGDIYYQAPSIKTNISNINNAIEIDQWNQIYALITNNTDLEGSLEIPVSFEGQPYEAHLSPLNITSFTPKNQLWVVTFRDLNLRYLRSYAIFLYSTAGVAILVLSFALMSLFFVISGRASHYLNIKQFSYSWFRPSRTKEKNYLLLTIFIGIHIVFFLNILLNDFHNFWFIVFLYCETVACIALYRFILLSSFLTNWKRVRYWIIPVLITMSIIGFTIFASLTGSLTGNKTGILVLLLILQSLGFICIALLQKRGWFNSTYAGESHKLFGTETIYALTFTIWIVLIGLMPGYTIHHSAFHFEDALWKKAVAANQNHKEHTSEEHYEPGAVQETLLNEMEYQRRNWLSNVIGITYPVINRYIYTEKTNIAEAFHQHEEGGEHGKELVQMLLLVFLFLLSAIFLFVLIRVLARQVFLTEYWDFNYKVGRVKNVYTQTYIVTLDKWKGVQFLQEKFLSDKSYALYDLAGTSLPSSGDVTKENKDGYVLLNIDYAIQSANELSSFTTFISQCRNENKFVLMTGSKSVKELYETEQPEPDAEFVKTRTKWLDSISYFSSILLPLDYDKPTFTDEIQTVDNDLLIRLKQDLRFGPHTDELNRLLMDKILQNESNKLTVTTYETFLLAVQRYSKAYYQNIWEKLSFREKQMVYNYSNEGFVNYRNFDVLTELLQKGVFRMDHYQEMICLFNQSFTNYATQAPTRDLLNKFKDDKKENGNVTQLRNAVLTFIFLIILGLSIIAPEMLNRYVGALSGGLAILSTLASILNKYTLKIPFTKEQ